MAKYVKNFNEWATNQYMDYTKDPEARTFNFATGLTLVVNINTGATGTAKCGEKDKFKHMVGIGVAYARMMGKEIPKEQAD